MATPEEMAAAMIANLEEKTGKTLSQWLALTGACGLEKHGQLVKWLKQEHGITHGYANLIAHETLAAGKPVAGQDDLVAAQYAGKKAGLWPIYEALLAAAKGLGSDVEVAPKKAYVSLRRSKQFALIQPSTATRVDLGLKLPDHPPGKRLEASGSFNAMVTHRLRLTSVEDVDAELRDWLSQAYALG